SRYSLVISALSRVSQSITRFWSINEHPSLQRRELSGITPLIPITRNRRASSPGVEKRGLLPIKKMLISSAASCAFSKFTASGCNRNDLVRERQCQKVHHRPSQLRQPQGHLLNRCRLIPRRFRQSAGELPCTASPEDRRLRTGRKKKPQRRLDPPGPGSFAVIGAFGVDV